MVGLAVGNLLGIGVEGWSRPRIAQRYPDGIREITAEVGSPDDDDLAQAIILAEATAEGALDIDDLGRRFWQWAEVNGAGMGILTHEVLALYGGDAPRFGGRGRSAEDARAPNGCSIIEASRRAWAGHRAGNGALMRCAPIAIRWHADPLRLVRESVISTVPTHWDPRCGWSCALANLAIAGALREEALSAEDLLRRSTEGVAAALPELRRYDYGKEPPVSVREAVAEASEARLEDLRFDGSDMGYTLLTLQAALICWWRAEDFESALREVVESGGDTDTNGAVVGAVLGARFGLDGIPPAWRAKTSAIRAGSISMESYADRVNEAVGA